MNKDIKQKWIKALRSGEYTQGNGRLKNKDNQYCCLGVLCDLALKEGIVKEEIDNTDDVNDSGFKFDGDAELLPNSVIDWASLVRSPKVLIGNELKELAELNDDGASFSRLAELIEKQL
jgi:hypothetical protein